jgi:tRNA threonylcarbamoyladenosine biosynthesis protein TsaB
MLVLAIDTCETRGSVSVAKDESVVETIVHSGAEEYSSWLLPAVDRALASSYKLLRDVDLFAVATGPGSFTGVRIGLTTVKAWSEVYAKPIAAVSRLEILAGECRSDTPYVAPFINAQRDQVFGALYKHDGDELSLVGAEMVSTPVSFMGWVDERVGSNRVAWVSTDPIMVTKQEAWRERSGRGESILGVPCVLSPLVGQVGFQKALQGHVLDALSLDANYVRRSYVEAFGKGSTHEPRA